MHTVYIYCILKGLLYVFNRVMSRVHFKLLLNLVSGKLLLNLVSGLNRVAKKLGIDCVPAMVGWDFHGGCLHPV